MTVDASLPLFDFWDDARFLGFAATFLGSADFVGARACATASLVQFFFREVLPFPLPLPPERFLDADDASQAERDVDFRWPPGPDWEEWTTFVGFLAWGLATVDDGFLAAAAAAVEPLAAVAAFLR